MNEEKKEAWSYHPRHIWASLAAFRIPDSELFLYFGTLKIHYQLTCLLRSARTNQLHHFDLSSNKDCWNLPMLIFSRLVALFSFCCSGAFGICFETASITYICLFSSKSNLKLILFFVLFRIHRCNLFVFIVCVPWVRLKIVRLIRTLYWYYDY